MNKRHFLKKIYFILFFIVTFYCHVSASRYSGICLSKNAEKNSNESISKPVNINFEYDENIQNLKTKIELLSSTITKLTIENIKFKKEIKKKLSYVDLMSSSKYGDSIGVISILVTIMGVILTFFGLIAGFSFYNNYKIIKKHNEDIDVMKSQILQASKSDIINISKKFMQDHVDEIEISFWKLTNIARKLEAVYWQELRELKDIELALDRNDKFKLAISNILSKNDIDQGLGFLFNLKITKSINILEESLYCFYKYGLFEDYKESFSRVIKIKFDCELKPWLKMVKKRRQEKGDSF